MSAALQIDDDFSIEHFADELKPGVQLLQGQYTIESFLNAGGFGITYMARDSLGRRVVVKECFPSAFCRRTGLAVGPSARQREDEFRALVALFRQEALNLARLDHPNIVKVHQVFDANQTAYMAMDHIDGPDLLHTVEGVAPRLEPGQIIEMLSSLLDALAYVHSQGLLHRDISPDNILLDRQSNRAVLIDFGAARKEVTRKSRAVSGLRVVKDGYSPQEFYFSGSKQGPHSDLYALAATFAHLVTGEVPKTSQERLSAIANREGDPQRPLLGRVQGYPPSFLAAIDKAMSIFPKDRLQSAAEWQAMLRETPVPPLRVVDSGPDRPAPDIAQPAQPQPTLQIQRRPIRNVGLGAIGAVAVLVAAAFWLPDIATLGPGADLTPIGGPAGGAPSGIVQGPAVQMPFVTDSADTALIEGALPWSPDWVVPGLRIVEVNGMPLQQGGDVRALLAGDADLTAAESLNVIFGFERMPGGDIVYKRATLPVVEQLRLPGGLVFEIRPGPSGVQTIVAELPSGAASDLRVGDVLVSYRATQERLETATALQDILAREADKAVATYGFAVQRNGSLAVASFTLAPTG